MIWMQLFINLGRPKYIIEIFEGALCSIQKDILIRR